MATLENMVNTGLVTIIVITTIAIVSAAPVLTTSAPATGDQPAGRIQSSGQGQLKRFSSYAELENFLTANSLGGDNEGYYYYGRAQYSNSSPSFAPAAALAEKGDDTDYLSYTWDTMTNNVDYSQTNIQVLGVDEADIVKSDGEFIYVVSGNKVFIIDAGPEDARILSTIEVDETPTGIFINGSKFVILGSTFVKVFDISNKENPVLKRNISFDGSYFGSRMIGDYVYVIINSPAVTCSYSYDYGENYYHWRREVRITLPEISLNGEAETVQASEIYYFDTPDYPYEFTTIMSINTRNDDEEAKREVFLMSAAQDLFVSSNNIYITYASSETESTVIHKISIADGEIEYKSQGGVPGCVLNQFSMDEYQGYFRIATTTGEVWRSGNGTARNHIYVLNEDLNIVGRLEGLAPGERIYSARFMGNRAYLVTFKKVDPLFVIDLADPTNPRSLGELEIPGYSDYLHPYDETHIIGVGKDTYDMGSFAWYQGVKIALFDVSDPQNPVEISKYVIGDRGTDSYALSDHKAFLFRKSKNLLVIPILLAEINEEQYYGPSTYGEYTWQGAYVFNISLTNGLVLKGGITHLEDNVRLGWDWDYSSNSIKRSLYIDNVLYTISDGMVKMNDLTDLSEINSIELA